MKAHFSVYPKYWGLHKTDKNIDHRRVLNLEVFLKRKGKSINVSKEKKEYLTGDLVTWRINDKLPHIGIVSIKLCVMVHLWSFIISVEGRKKRMFFLDIQSSLIIGGNKDEFLFAFI